MKHINLMLKFALAIILVSGIAAFAQTPTSKTPTASVEKIMLVSDNEADVAVALSVASDLNLPVISTNWGQFQKATLDKIVSLSPKEVIIIGGSSAVPAKYSEDLVKAGIKTTVIGGKTRQQTSIEVFKK